MIVKTIDTTERNATWKMARDDYIIESSAISKFKRTKKYILFPKGPFVINIVVVKEQRESRIMTKAIDTVSHCGQGP